MGCSSVGNKSHNSPAKATIYDKGIKYCISYKN